MTYALPTMASIQAAPSPSPLPAAQASASEFDTTMEEDDEDDAPPPQPQQQPQEEEDVFSFNAPTYYDLKNPEMERQYVNNADGYFYQSNQGLTTPQRPSNAVLKTPQRTPVAQHTPRTLFSSHKQATPHTPCQQQPVAQATTPRTPFQQPHTTQPHTPFGAIQQPQVAHIVDGDVDVEMAEDEDNQAQPQSSSNAEDDERMSDGGHSDSTLVLDMSTSSAAVPSAPTSTLSTSLFAATRSHNATTSVPSSLLQPTKASLQRVQAAQTARTNEGPVEYSIHKRGRAKPQLTRPRSPQFHTSLRHHNEPKLSSTSRELLKIHEEKLRAQQETAKIREFHERVRAQRLPANVHQRSTKQLTIPESPHLEVDLRSRRLNRSMQSDDGTEASSTEPRGFIPPEQLLLRDFEFPATHVRPQTSHHDVAVPHTPQLRTSERAARRNVFGEEQDLETPPRPDYSKMKVNGLTKPVTPQFETDRRAQQAASYRKPMPTVDKDAEELKNKFHARPVPKKILEPPARSLPPNPVTKAPLTKPVSPKLATTARARMHSADEEPQNNNEKSLSSSNGPRPRTGPTVPETPPLRSIHRHRMYQEEMKRRREAEEDELRRQREFKAQPIRMTSTPPRFEGSKKPLTEVLPFAFRGDQIHERAQERIEQLRREEEERSRAAAQFKATLMPDLTPEEPTDTQAHRVRHLTKPHSPKLAVNRRASERAAFEAAERDRRAREEAQRRLQEEERKQQEEEEIKRLRREQLTFHARPVPAPRFFELKPNKRPLTEPESPLLHTKMRSTAHGPTSAA